MNQSPHALYEIDFSAWALRNAELLKQGRVAEADIDHIREELEGLARKDRNELVSRLIVFLAHLLKWQYQLTTLQGQWQEFTGKSWAFTIDEQRMQIQRQLKMSPSLKSFFADAIAEAYPDAMKLASRETKLEKNRFPPECPFTQAQILNEDFFPTASPRSDRC